MARGPHPARWWPTSQSQTCGEPQRLALGLTLGMAEIRHAVSPAAQHNKHRATLGRLTGVADIGHVYMWLLSTSSVHCACPSCPLQSISSLFFIQFHFHVSTPAPCSCIQPDHLSVLALPVAEFLALLHNTSYLGYSQRGSAQGGSRAWACTLTVSD